MIENISSYLFNRVAKDSVKKHIALSNLASIVLVNLVAVTTASAILSYITADVMRVSIAASEKRLQATLPEALWQYNTTSLHNIVEAESEATMFNGIEVHSKHGFGEIRLFAWKNPRTGTLEYVDSVDKILNSDQTYTVKLFHDGTEVGYAVGHTSATWLNNLSYSLLASVVSTLLASSLLLTFLQRIFLKRYVWNRLNALSDDLKELTTQDLTSTKLEHDNSIEFREITQHVTTIQQKLLDLVVIGRKHEDDLEKMVDELHKTHEAMVQSEKMAALGALVAGVAHELNTPIGNALVTATTVVDNTKEFKDVLLAGKLSKSSFIAFSDRIESGLTICVRSLSRAAALIESFKQIAVDQTNEQVRAFKLTDTLEETLAVLHSNIQKSNVQVVDEVDKSIELVSYPGGVYQIVSNIINNALIHAFEPDTSGIITIRATDFDADNRLLLTISDNGRGIPEAVQHKIFEPFFTTKFGVGGSGLGLSICKNIARKNLNGDILVKSNCTGTTFTLIMQKRLPSNCKIG